MHFLEVNFAIARFLGSLFYCATYNQINKNVSQILENRVKG